MLFFLSENLHSMGSKIFLLFLMSIMTISLSCTRLVFSTNNDLPITISSRDKTNTKYIEVTSRYESMLWGIVPPDHELKVDEFFRQFDIESVGNLTITKEQTFFDQILMYFSFGIYIPFHITYSGWGVKKQ